MIFPNSRLRQLIWSRLFIVLFVSSLAISLSISYVVSEPSSKDRFLSINTLGSNMMMKDYYPKGNSTINLGDHVKWYLRVYNGMGSTEYLSVRLKLLNSTQKVPDHFTNLPSPENYIFEVKHLLMKNSTWVIPLDWVVTEVDKSQDSVVIKGLKVNGIDVNDLDVRSSDGKNFRMIFELWRYDPESKDFSFDWPSATGKRSTWNQIWFSVN